MESVQIMDEVSRLSQFENIIEILNTGLKPVFYSYQKQFTVAGKRSACLSNFSMFFNERHLPSPGLSTFYAFSFRISNTLGAVCRREAMRLSFAIAALSSHMSYKWPSVAACILFDTEANQYYEPVRSILL